MTIVDPLTKYNNSNILNQSISTPSHLNIDWSSEYSDSRDKRATTAGLFKGANPYRIGTNIHMYKYMRPKSFIRNMF
jgi:hypothetical protein